MASKHIDIGPFTGWIIDHEGIKPASHVFVGSVDVDGNVYNWNCMRQGESYLQLGSGYVAVRTVACCICSTDLALQFFPFPLPIVPGHEIACKLHCGEDGNLYAVEINASHAMRDYETATCAFCRNGLSIHCPERLTIGINRLNGGQGEFLLVPRNALIPSNLSPLMTCMIEPFSAALHAVKSTTFRENDRVAVLGPRKLGVFIVAALTCCKQSRGFPSNVHIVAIARHKKPLDICSLLGVDESFDISQEDVDTLKRTFHVVYDTTGSSSGFDLATDLVRNNGELHLKSTCGQESCGVRHMTEMVVDEISLWPIDSAHESFDSVSLPSLAWDGCRLPRRDSNTRHMTMNVFVSEKCKPFNHIVRRIVRRWESDMHDRDVDHAYVSTHCMTTKEAYNYMLEAPADEWQSPFRRYDVAIVGDISELDGILRPDESSTQTGVALVIPRGHIIVLHHQTGKSDNSLCSALSRGVRLRTSRCGNLYEGHDALNQHPFICKILEKEMLSHRFPASKVAEAFVNAQHSNAIKVLVDYDTNKQ